MELQARPRASGPQCPLCRELLGGELAESVHTCAGCQTHYHSSCVAELGGCATLGCDFRGRATAAPVATPVAQPEHVPLGRTLTSREVRHAQLLRELEHARERIPHTGGKIFFGVGMAVLTVFLFATDADDLMELVAPPLLIATYALGWVLTRLLLRESDRQLRERVDRRLEEEFGPEGDDAAESA